MTDPKSTLRKRRAAGTAGGPSMPPEIAQWLRGESSGPPIAAYITPYWERLPAAWQDFVRRHPGVQAPPGVGGDALLTRHLGITSPGRAARSK